MSVRTRNRLVIDAPPAIVVAILADGWAYDDWVVGAKRIRAVDPGWPETGARFHHCVGAGPMTLEDSTQVLRFDADRGILLKAFFRPIGAAEVSVDVSPHAGGTGSDVTITEMPVAGPVRRIPDPAVHALLLARNALSLRRLRRLARRRNRAADHQSGPTLRDATTRPGCSAP